MVSQTTLFTQRQRESFTIKPGEDRVPDLVYFIDRATGDILFVCGEGDPTLWDNEQITQAFTRFLSRETTNRLIFSLSREESCKSVEEVAESIREQNPRLFEIALKWPDHVKGYWTPKRPDAHYAILGNTVMFESEHKPDVKPKVTFIIGDTSLANTWRKNFWEFIKYNKFVPLES